MNNMTLQSNSRRKFLKDSALLMSGLVIGFYLPVKSGRAYAAEAQPKPVYPPNAFIRIAPDNSITIIVNKSEMGQGVYTSLPMLVAEELEADWKRIFIESAPVAAVYNHTGFGMQLTGGSSSIPSSWEQMRRVGAAGRILLIRAAAQQWSVPESECHAENSQVIHANSNRKLSYGALANAAAKLPLPDNVPLKDPKDFKLIGKPVKRLDTPVKINGSAQFGLDVYLPNMLTVLIARSPVFGGKVKRFDATEARKLKGVQGIYQVPSGIAVAATGFWPAKTARDLLEIEWDEGPGAKLSTPKMRAEYLELAKFPGAVARKEGDTLQGFKEAVKTVSAEYEVPYLAHAMMEPLNVVVDLKPDHCTIWTGTQAQTMDRAMAATTAGLKLEQVEIHTTYLGGGFGRRANPRSDFMQEAVQVAKVIRKPIKVVWTREDDMRGGYYRPMWADHIEAGIDKDGKPLAWKHTIVGQSITADTPFEPYMIKNGVDVTSVEGASTLPYLIPNLQVELHSPKNAVPVQWWRSVGHSHTAFIVETMIDELAHLAGKDPVAYRLDILPAASRYRGVLTTGRRKSRMGQSHSARRPCLRRRGAPVVQQLRGTGRGSVAGERQDTSASRGGRGGLRHGRQSRRRAATGRRRHRVRTLRRIAWGDHAGERPRRAIQLRQVHAAALVRNAAGRGAYRCQQRTSYRHRRTGHTADRTGSCQRRVRPDRQTPAPHAVRQGSPCLIRTTLRRSYWRRAAHAASVRTSCCIRLRCTV